MSDNLTVPDVPDLDRLEKVVNRFLVASSLIRSDQPDTPYVKIMGPSVDDVAFVLDAARFLLSLAGSGGRLVVEQPCSHGFVRSHLKELCLELDHSGLSGRAAHHPQCSCPGGTRTVVWPTDKEEG
jgi:hypothetical protein